MRDQTTIELTNTGWLDNGSTPSQPCLRLHITLSSDDLAERFQPGDGSTYRPSDLDLYFRDRSSSRAAVEGGILTVSDRLTGDLLLEAVVNASVIERFVSAVRQYAARTGNDRKYTVELQCEGTIATSFEKQIFIVYNAENELLRERSVIPAHIEL